ncbi:acetamidase [Periconia macrospinosa]|uniref:amidase n=1 Tax=Periconia macrospinosa TaxID=97972 RepID=A0A2V1DSG7_9PLEO|nr:acetamidase [Periconia macrospinosa]
MSTNDWKDISVRKKEEQLSRIPPSYHLPLTPTDDVTNYLSEVRRCGLLTEQEISITEVYDATALAAAIRKRELRVVDVTQAFCKRAAIAHQFTNCLTEILFEEALDRARFLDAHLDSGKTPLGPLHGVPVSLKDTFKIKGYDASIGLAARCFQPADENSVLVDLLLKAGAVLYCKTNVPQTLVALDSHNNIFGRTINPLHTALTAGGSSGGEGALLAMRGSVLGVGTDVGGSIRIPSMCHGLYGLKPSCQRIPYAGQEEGQKPAASKVSISASAGPIARSMRDIDLFFTAISKQKPWEHDPDVIPSPWTPLSTPTPDRTTKKTLTIGVVRTDGITTPHPPISNLLTEVATTLSHSNKLTLVELNLAPLLSQCQPLVNALLSIEGANHAFDLLESFNEPLSPWLQPRLRRKPPGNLDKARELQARRTQLQKQFLDVWKTGSSSSSSSSSSGGVNEIDALICPVAPHPVPPIDTWNSVNYTAAFNLLDLPAGVLPVRTFSTRDLRGEMESSGVPVGSWDKYNRSLWTNFNRKVYMDSPLCIQVVAPRLQEEKLVHIMSVVDSILHRDAPSGEFDRGKNKTSSAKL